MTQMQLKFQASKFIEALDFANTVAPRSLGAQQNSAAFLFTCKMDNGKPICRIYSRGENQVTRAGFELDELDGEGIFTMPSTHADLIRDVPDDVVTIESSSKNNTDGEAFEVEIRSTSGTRYKHTTFDPRLITPLDRDFEAALKNQFTEYPVGILREALRMAKPFLPGADKKGDISEHFNTIQIFDESKPDWARGNGSVFCSDGSRAFYFDFDGFKDKGFYIHSKHVGQLAEFLGKCNGVHIYRGAAFSFAVNTVKIKEKDATGTEVEREIETDQVFGWNHVAQMHSRYAYYSLGRDKYVILAPKSTLLKSLGQASKLIDQRKDRVKFYYQHTNSQTGSHTIHFGTSESAGNLESFYVSTFDKKDETGNIVEPSLESDFDCYVNLDNFKSIIADAAGQVVELRISPIEKDANRPRGGAMLRTIDSVRFDANGKPTSGDTPVRYTCTVTRFMPSSV